MFRPLHDREAFFKYYPVSSAMLTLRTARRKWSTPFLFNDPFDNQFNLCFEEATSQLAKEALQDLSTAMSSSVPFESHQFGPMTPMMEFLRQVHAANPDIKYSSEEEEYLLGGVVEGMRRVNKILPEINAEIRRIMADTSIFCMSETHDICSCGHTMRKIILAR